MIDQPTKSRKGERHVSWSSDEVCLLKINYPIYGPKYCMNNLDRSYSSVIWKAMCLGLKYNPRQQKIIKKLDGNKVLANCKKHGEVKHYNFKYCHSLRCGVCEREKIKKFNKTERGKEVQRIRARRWYQNPKNRFIQNIRGRLNKCYYGKQVHFKELGYTGEQLKNHVNMIKDQQNNRCPVCLTSYENCKMNIEHTIPLFTANSKKEIINLFQLSNLSVMCGNCNSSKYNKDLSEWLKNKEKL